MTKKEIDKKDTRDYVSKVVLNHTPKKPLAGTSIRNLIGDAFYKGRSNQISQDKAVEVVAKQLFAYGELFLEYNNDQSTELKFED